MRRTDGGLQRRLRHEHYVQTPEKRASHGVCPRRFGGNGGNGVVIIRYRIRRQGLLLIVK